MEYNKESFRKLLIDTYEEKNEEAYNNKCKKIWDFLIGEFNKYKFKKVIVVDREPVKEPFTKRIPGRFYMEENVMLYRNPSTGAKYYTYDELLEKEGTNLCVTQYTWEFHEKISKYFKDLDIICIYTFNGWSSCKNHYKVEGIKILLRKSEGYDGKYVFNLEEEKEGFSLSTPYSWAFEYKGSEILYKKGKEAFNEAIFEMYGTTVYNKTANNYATICDNYYDFLSSSDTLKPKNKSLQAEIDELVKIPLSNDVDKKTIKALGKSLYRVPSITKISHVKENVSVLRWMLYSPIINKAFDGLRIYYKDGKYISCKRDNSGKFVQYPIDKLNMNNFCSDVMCEIKLEDVEGTPFKYYYEVVNKLENKTKSFALLSFIKYPRIEQLAKMGFDNYLSRVFARSGGHPYEEICDTLYADESAKNVNKFIGLNAYQISAFQNQDKTNVFNGSESIPIIKKTYFGQKDISSIDNETFDKVYNSILKYGINGSYYFEEIMHIIRSTENQELFKNFTNKVLEKLLKLSNDNYSTMYTYRDYIQMVSEMNMFGQFKINFEDYDELRNMHDIVSSLYEIKKTEIQTKAFKKNVKKMEKFEFSSEKLPFVVVAPKEADDVAKEGIDLHHCVKSYIPRIANGSTNIIFIRKKEEVDKPFFTVEISNEGAIEQVHGFGNRNANTEEGLTDFVKKWAKTKKLKLTNINKIR